MSDNIQDQLEIPKELIEMGAPLSPQFHEMVYRFAYHYYENGKYEEAIRFFRFLTNLNPFHVEYWKGLAASRQMKKYYEEAIEAYKVAAAISQEANDPYISLHAADCFLALDQIENAREALSCAREMAKKHPDRKTLISHIDLITKAWKNKV